MWYAASVPPLRITTLRTTGQVAASSSAAVSLYDQALSAAPEELRVRRLGAAGLVLRDFLIVKNASTALRDAGGQTRAVAKLLAAAEAVGASPQLVSRAAKRIAAETANSDDAPQRAAQSARLTEVARLLKFASDTFGRRAHSDARLFCEGLHKLHDLPLFQAADELVLTDLHLTAAAAEDSLPPSAWLTALDVLLRGNRPLRIGLPAVDDRPPLQRALKPFFDAIYKRHDLAIELDEACPLGPFSETDTAWSRFVRSLFLPRSVAPLVQPGELDGQVTFHPASSPKAEAQAVAAHVQRLLESGVSAAQIAVVSASADRRKRLWTALSRAGVPTAAMIGGVAGPSSRAAELPPSLRLLSLLFEVLFLGLPREGFIQILTNRYLRFPGPLGERPWLLAQALRTAGVRTLRHPERTRPVSVELWDSQPAAEPTWGLVRLRAWLATQLQPLEAEAERRRPPHLPLLLEQVELSVRELTSLPIEATLAEHCRALSKLLQRLGFFERSSERPKLPSDDEAASADLCTRLLDAHHRDVAAAAMLAELLDELPKWATRLGQTDQAFSQREFAQLLRISLGRLWHEQQLGSQPHAVCVGDLGDIAPRTYTHLVIAGLVDGELPTFQPEDSLLPDEDRRLLDRLAERPLWPQASQLSDGEPLKLVVALAHCEHVHLYWSTADEEGRPLPHSLFLDEICFAAAVSDDKLKSRPEAVPVVHLSELWRQAAQNAALFSALSRQERPRATRLSALLAIEEQRSRFFSATIADAESAISYSHPFVGRLLDDSLIAVLQPRLPGSPKHPLSASVLEDYARCPFRFFARRVLGIRPANEGSEELDPLASGRLHHAVLEAFFKDRLAQHRVPLRADDDDRTALEQAIETVVADFVKREHIGHPALLRVRLGRLRVELLRLIKNEAAKPPEEGCTPALFEWKFGPLAIAAATGDEGRMALHIHGIIDRVDIGKGKAVVLDYKAGRLDRYQAQLREKLLKTSFQLPLYVAALRADPAVQSKNRLDSVVARYYSLRQGLVTDPLDDPDMTTLDPTARQQNPDGNVAEVAYRLWRRLRDGDFAVIPQTCEGCGLESVCRISTAPLDVPAEGNEPSQNSDSDDSLAASQQSPTRDFEEGDGR